MSSNASGRDVELAPSQPCKRKRLEGYPSFAHFIAKDKDAAIFRKFQHLSARSLLYQQSYLHELESQLRRLDEEDAESLDNDEAQEIARKWEQYSGGDGRAAQHRALQLKIKAAIKEYHEALILEKEILALEAPSPRTWKAFSRWFQSTATPVLWGRDRELFTDAADVVALAPVDSDRLNRVLRRYCGWFLKDDGTYDADTGMYYFSDRRIQWLGAFVSGLLSALLLIGAIVCLLLVSDKGAGIRLGMIVLFTCLFAGVVSLLTNARRAEIFASTAAYAAVLVVFVGNGQNKGWP